MKGLRYIYHCLFAVLILLFSTEHISAQEESIEVNRLAAQEGAKEVSRLKGQDEQRGLDGLLGQGGIANPVLDGYISTALESNEGLKQAKLDYASNLAALQEAKGLFFPEVSLNARYTVSDGGRVISFPIGDLLNPVYSTLNMLTLSEQFPQVENEDFPFYRPREQETKVRLVQPIYNSDLIHNIKIKQQQSEIARIGVEVFSQELIREVTKAYYSYVKACQLNDLADTTMMLVEENLRVSRSLFNNDKVTIDVVYRSQSEVSKVEVQKAQVRNLVEASRSYFNFLLNRDLSADIELSEESLYLNALSAEDAMTLALSNRLELSQLKAYSELNDRHTALLRGSHMPGLYGVLDYGFQGEDYNVSMDDDFVMASVVFQWDLMHGRTKHRKVQRSKIEGERLQSMYRQAEQQIRLEVINDYYGLQAAYETVLAAQMQLQSSRRAYVLVNRKYQEGQASLLELIDARAGLTNASSNVIIARSDYFTGLADFHYAIGERRNIQEL